MPFHAAHKRKWADARRTYTVVRRTLPTSDTDFRGVFIAPKSYYHGFVQGVHQVVQTSPAPDLTVFEIRKFFNLAYNVNPNVIELLFTDPSDHLIAGPAWEKILSHRDAFLSRRAKHTFSPRPVDGHVDRAPGEPFQVARVDRPVEGHGFGLHRPGRRAASSSWAKATGRRYGRLGRACSAPRVRLRPWRLRRSP
jgi:hypothetical protein